MPPLGFQVGPMRPVLPADQVALLIHALERHDQHRPGAAAAALLLGRIRQAAAVDQPPFEHVQVDRAVAAVLVGAINVVDREIGAPDEMRELRLRASQLAE
jgi:hypothetical protein